MAIKSTVYEICQRCGQQQAWLDTDGSVRLSHNCPQAPPGPPNPPRRYRPGEVVFVAKPTV